MNAAPKKPSPPSARFLDLVPRTEHSNAIALLTSGVDVKTGAARLGHNPALLLRTYAHFVPSADGDAADRLGAALAF